MTLTLQRMVDTAVIMIVLTGAHMSARADDGELPYGPCYRVERILQAEDLFCSQWGGSSRLYGVNRDGTLFGTVTCVAAQPRAIIWRMGEPPELVPLPPGTSESHAVAINDAGMVTGRFTNSSFLPEFSPKGYVWNTRTNEMHFILSPSGSGQTLIGGMNDSGEVVGYFIMPGQSPSGQAFHWKEGKVRILQEEFDFGGRPNAAGSISSDGTIGGYFPAGGGGGQHEARPFVIHVGVFYEFDAWPEGWGGTSGTVALNGGRFLGQSNPHLDFPPNEFRTVLGGLRGYELMYENPSVTRRSVPRVSNDAGDVAGFGFSWVGNARAILFRNDRIHLLRDLVLTEDLPIITHPSLDAAYGLSSDGQIAANRYHLVPVAPPLGDLNGNCRRDLDDLKLLLAQWGPVNGAPHSADLNEDGTVDFADMLKLLSLMAHDDLVVDEPF